LLLAETRTINVFATGGAQSTVLAAIRAGVTLPEKITIPVAVVFPVFDISLFEEKVELTVRKLDDELEKKTMPVLLGFNATNAPDVFPVLRTRLEVALVDCTFATLNVDIIFLYTAAKLSLAWLKLAPVTAA
jgi:hypothetical protein